MQENYCDLNVVFDSSLSMCRILKESEEGFNAWLQSQKEAEGKATISLIEFNDFYYDLYMGIPVQDAPPYKLKPRGNTALYDAIGKAVKNTGYRLECIEEKDKPSKVLFVVITDGKENCSRLYNLQDIQEMIRHQREKHLWEFVFLGANIDAVETGSRLGIPKDYAMTYVANYSGVFSAYDSLSNNTISFRRGIIGGHGFFSPEDRLAQAHALEKAPLSI